MKYTVVYSKEALADIEGIFSYIKNDLFERNTAVLQVNRIREAVHSLDMLPERGATVKWEPWQSMGMRQLLIDNFIAYYLIDNQLDYVTIIRILYSAQNIEKIIKEDN